MMTEKKQKTSVVSAAMDKACAVIGVLGLFLVFAGGVLAQVLFEKSEGSSIGKNVEVVLWYTIISAAIFSISRTIFLVLNQRSVSVSLIISLVCNNALIVFYVIGRTLA